MAIKHWKDLLFAISIGVCKITVIDLLYLCYSDTYVKWFIFKIWQ